MRPSSRSLIFGISLLAFAGCAGAPVNYQEHMNSHVARFRKGDFGGAAAAMEISAAKKGHDQLIFLLNRAMALQNSGAYLRSSELLWRAEKILKLSARELPYRFYSGEDFERILISVMHSVNMVMLGRTGDAINESRRAEQELDRLRRETGKDFYRPLLLRYLPALVYESEGNYKPALTELQESRGLVHADRFNLDTDEARLSLRDLQQERARKLVPPEKLIEQYREIRDAGTLVLLFENDVIADKIRDAHLPEISELGELHVKYARAVLFVDGNERERTEPALDIDRLARENFRYKLDHEMRERKEGEPPRPRPGYLRDIDRRDPADLRHWATLPANIQLARVSLRPGTHRVMLRLEAENGKRSSFRDLGEVEIKSPGETKFLLYRSVDER